MTWFMLRAGWTNTAAIAVFAMLPVVVTLVEGLAG